MKEVSGDMHLVATLGALVCSTLALSSFMNIVLAVDEAS